MSEFGREIETFPEDNLNPDGEISLEKDRVRIHHISGHGKIPAEDFEVGRLEDLEPVFKG